MEFGINKKIKVVWICHFSNQKVRDRLPLSQMKFKNTIKALLGKKSKHSYHDFAPWVTNLIKEFEKFDDIELHIIAPHYGLTRFTHEFEMNGVFYHFFKPDLSLIYVNMPKQLYWKGRQSFFINRFLVKKFLSVIRPDIVNLIGTENPYYTIVVLDIKNIPVYVSAQTVYSNPIRKQISPNFKQVIWDNELLIHKKEMYFGCTGRMHRDLILKNNVNAIIFKMFFPISKPNQVKLLPKVYDFVYFGSIDKNKGIEDAIKALAVVKKAKNNVSLNIVGRCSSKYLSFLKSLISELNLENNIVLNDYFQSQTDLHQHIIQSYYALLPMKLDIISGTIIEAILLGLPVITNKTSGTPYLNKDGEIVLLSKIGDINMLASNMLRMLESPELSAKLEKNAKTFVKKEFDNTVSAIRLVNNYKAVINHYKYNNSIPAELLFDIIEFPVY